MSMELLGDAYVLPIAFLVGVAAHFVVQKFKSSKKMTLKEAWAYTAILRPSGNLFPNAKPRMAKLPTATSVTTGQLKHAHLMSDHDIVSRLAKHSEEETAAAIEKLKAKKIEDLKLQIMAQNPTGLFVGIPDVEKDLTPQIQEHLASKWMAGTPASLGFAAVAGAVVGTLPSDFISHGISKKPSIEEEDDDDDDDDDDEYEDDDDDEYEDDDDDEYEDDDDDEYEDDDDEYEDDDDDLEDDDDE